MQTFGMAVHDGYLNTAWCIFCNRGDGGPLSGFDDTWGAKPDNLKPCSTCPMACHKTCYTAFTGDLDVSGIGGSTKQRLSGCLISQTLRNLFGFQQRSLASADSTVLAMPDGHCVSKTLETARTAY